MKPPRWKSWKRPLNQGLFRPEKNPATVIACLPEQDKIRRSYMSKPKVLISDKMNPLAAEIFEQKGCDVTVRTGMSEDELLAVIGEFDGLAIRSSTYVTPKVLEAAKNLKVIGRAGIGVDNVDVKEATNRG